MALATLSIDLVAQLGRFEADMGRAARVAEQAASRIDRVFTGANKAFALLGGAALGSQFFAGFQGAVDAADQLSKLSQRSGIAVEELSALKYAGELSDVSLEDLSTTLDKLNRNIATAAAGGKTQAAAFAAIGVAVRDATGQVRAADQVLGDLAQAFASYADGPNKVAIANEIFGRSGARVIPLLNAGRDGLREMREEAERLGIVISTETARGAERFNDNMTRLGKNIDAVSLGIASNFVPGLVQLSDTFLAASKEGGKFQATLITIGQALAALTGSDDLGKLQSQQAAQANAIALLNLQLEKFSALAARGVPGAEKRVEELKGQLRSLLNESLKVTAAIKSEADKLTGVNAPTAAPKIEAPALPDVAGIAAGQREAQQRQRAVLDQALKNLESTFASERDAITFQQRYLEAQQQQGLVSLQEYYTRRAELQQRGLDVELGKFREQEQALKAALAGTADPSDRVKVQTQIQDVQAQAARARAEFSQRTQLDQLQEGAGYERLTAQVREFAAALLELQGDAAGAAGLRAAAAIDAARRLADQARGRGLIVDVDGLARAIDLEAELASGRRSLGRINESAAEAEERFLIAARERGSSQVEIERGLFAVRADSLAQLAALSARADSLALGIDAEDHPAVRFARQMRLELARAADAVDPLRTRLMAVADDIGKAWAGVIEDALVDGDWEKAGETIMRDLVRGLLNENVTQPLQQAFSSLLKGGIGAPGGNSGAGIFTSLLDDIFGFFGFSGGGYTGSSPVQMPAGVVHGQEYVFSAPAVRAIGVPVLEQLHRSARGGAPRLGVPGYADGGLVGPWRGGAAKPMTTGAAPVLNVHIHNNAAGVKATTRRRSDGGMDVFIDEAERALGDRIDAGVGLARNISGRFTLTDGASLPR